MMDFNIFKIWEQIGRITPFAVRRANWGSEYYTVVEKIECEKMPYGKAYGFSTVNGTFTSHYSYDKKWRETQLIPCCGNYQWTLVDDTMFNIEDIKLLFSLYQKVADRIHSKFYFGKYSGETIENVFIEDPNYIKWAITNIDKFFLDNDVLDYFESVNHNFRFNEISRKVILGKRQTSKK